MAVTIRGFELDIGRLRDVLPVRFPLLHLVELEHGAIVRGSIAIENDGTELDRFGVQIDLAPMGRAELPSVRETEGRIPWTADRHVNGDGSCCVCLPEDYFLTHPGPFDLVAFLDGPVQSYFIGQALVERGEPWPLGEWKHGVDGYSEWLRAFLDGLEPDRARAYLAVLELNQMKGHIPCPCGSGRRIRSCHIALVNRLRTVTKPKEIRGLRQRSRI